MPGYYQPIYSPYGSVVDGKGFFTQSGQGTGLATPDWINIAEHATGGTGSTANPLTGWDTAIAWGAKHYYAPGLEFSAPVSPAGWNTPGFVMTGDGPSTFFRFTTPGDGFSIQNNTYATNTPVYIADLCVRGLATTTNAFHFKNCHRSTFSNLKVVDGCTAAGLLIEGNVGGEVGRFSCDVNDGGFAAATPVNGIKFDQSGASQQVTTTAIQSPRVAGVSGDGILFTSAICCNVFGGYSENSAGIGLNFTAGASRCASFGLDCEGNATDATRNSGDACSIFGGQNAGNVNIQAAASGYGIFGGGHDLITNNGLGGVLAGIRYKLTAGGGITDTAGNLTDIANWNANAGTLDPNLVRDSSARTTQTAAGGVLTVSGNAISITRNIHHVGAGLIKTINLPTTINGAAITSGFIYGLIPDAAYTYDATGNIVVPGGGGTATINRLMMFTWDGTKHTPSY